MPGMTSQDAITAAVERLATAQETRVPCAAVRDLIGTDDLAAAYAVQQGLVQKRLSGGATVVGRKIGATSEAVQDQLGVDQPDFGYLLDDMDVSDAAAIRATISMRTLLQPRVEAEVAFVLARDVDMDEDDITIETVRGCVEVALPALEIVDSRIENWDIKFTDTVADNASSGLYVVGRRGQVARPARAARRRDVADASTARCAPPATAPPASATRWRHCAGWPSRRSRFGDPLRAGQVVLSGALGPFVPFAPGDRVEASISGFDPLNVRFTD